MILVPESFQRDIAKPPEDYTSKCGNRNINGVDVTVNGKEDAKQLTQFGEWPNMCAISTLVRISQGLIQGFYSEKFNWD